MHAGSFILNNIFDQLWFPRFLIIIDKFPANIRFVFQFYLKKKKNDVTAFPHFVENDKKREQSYLPRIFNITCIIQVNSQRIFYHILG